MSLSYLLTGYRVVPLEELEAVYFSFDSSAKRASVSGQLIIRCRYEWPSVGILWPDLISPSDAALLLAVQRGSRLFVPPFLETYGWQI